MKSPNTFKSRKQISPSGKLVFFQKRCQIWEKRKYRPQSKYGWRDSKPYACSNRAHMAVSAIRYAKKLLLVQLKRRNTSSSTATGTTLKTQLKGNSCETVGLGSIVIGQQCRLASIWVFIRCMRDWTAQNLSKKIPTSARIFYLAEFWMRTRWLHPNRCTAR